MSILDKFKKKKPEKIEKPVISKPVMPKKEGIRDKKRLAVIYGILKEPHITEKATGLAEDKNKYVFKISAKANKTEIKKAILDLYGVNVTKVNIIHMAPKKRRLGRFEGWKKGLKKGFKKAVVTLKQGDKIEIMPR